MAPVVGEGEGANGFPDGGPPDAELVAQLFLGRKAGARFGRRHQLSQTGGRFNGQVRWLNTLQNLIRNMSCLFSRWL